MAVSAPVLRESETATPELVSDTVRLSRAVRLQSVEGTLFDIDDDVVAMCPTVRNMLSKQDKSAFRNTLGGQFTKHGKHVIMKREGRVLATLVKENETEAVISLPNVKATTITSVLDFLRAHLSDMPEKELKGWQAAFVDVPQNVLCEIASAAYSLDIKPLVTLTSRAIASQIKESAAVAPVDIAISEAPLLLGQPDSVRSRLQRRIHSRRQARAEDAPETDPKAPGQQADTRSLDEIMNFISGGGGGGGQGGGGGGGGGGAANGAGKKGKKKGKKKKKKKKSNNNKNNGNGNNRDVVEGNAANGNGPSGGGGGGGQAASNTSNDDVDLLPRLGGDESLPIATATATATATAVAVASDRRPSHKAYAADPELDLRLGDVDDLAGDVDDIFAIV